MRHLWDALWTYGPVIGVILLATLPILAVLLFMLMWAGTAGWQG